jgi:hypothetical protein
MDMKTYLSVYGDVPVYDPYEVDDFFFKPPPHLVKPRENVDLSNPRNLYKWILRNVDYLKDRFIIIPGLNMDDKIQDCGNKYEEIRNVYEKNWRLHSDSWTDYEKKKVTTVIFLILMALTDH